MILFRELERLRTLHKLIQEQHTGTPEEFAKKMHISRRHLYNIIDELRDIGADIIYDSSACTFYYHNDFELDISFRVSIMGNWEEKVILGGNFSSQCNFCALKPSIFVDM